MRKFFYTKRLNIIDLNTSNYALDFNIYEISENNLISTRYFRLKNTEHLEDCNTEVRNFLTREGIIKRDEKVSVLCVMKVDPIDFM